MRLFWANTALQRASHLFCKTFPFWFTHLWTMRFICATKRPIAEWGSHMSSLPSYTSECAAGLNDMPRFWKAELISLLDRFRHPCPQRASKIEAHPFPPREQLNSGTPWGAEIHEQTVLVMHWMCTQLGWWKRSIARSNATQCKFSEQKHDH